MKTILIGEESETVGRLTREAQSEKQLEILQSFQEER